MPEFPAPKEGIVMRTGPRGGDSPLSARSGSAPDRGRSNDRGGRSPAVCRRLWQWLSTLATERPRHSRSSPSCTCRAWT